LPSNRAQPFARLKRHFGGGIMLASRSIATLVEDDIDGAPAAAPAMAATRTPISLSVADDLSLVEQDWRAFEREADCSVFQTFDWQAAWLRHVGGPAGVIPAVVTGRDAGGRILFMLPLAIAPFGPMRRLTFLASDLCDYNGPLLARDFAARAGTADFIVLWKEIGRLLRRDARFRHHAVVLEKMPATIGGQPNPMTALSLSLNPSGAYLSHLTADWDSFYSAKRTASRKQRERRKRKRLADHGAIAMATQEDPAGIASTLGTLFDQKSRSFARMGVPNIFKRPGYTDFYLDIARQPSMRSVVHVSRLEVGGAPAATNLGLVFGGCYYHILASYDDGEVSRFGPGAIHLQEIIKYAISRGCHAFDFTIGDEAYKREWCDVELKLYDYRAAATPRGLFFTLPAIVAARTKRTIKQNPVLWRVASRVRATLGSRKKPAVATAEEGEGA
jgi:CelD/BcsL family acetyltransferase involved in cellulose biosynthesis